MAPKIEKEEIHKFSAELAQELGAAIDARFAEHHWAFALIIEPGIRVFAAIENGKARYSLSAFADNGRAQSIAGDCGVTMSRGAAVAAHEIRTRLLPDLLPVARGALVKFKEEDETCARVARKAESLAKRYPNLKIRVDASDAKRVTISTKYGAGMHLDAYAYEESPHGNWRLTSERGRAFAMDKLDSKYGRAFLKLCNDN